jgi:alginate O-acetyltransferase complex protein AlgI
MLFNSYIFILLFLPVTLIVYFFLNGRKLTLASKAWLVFASLFFYGWWNPIYIPLILASILFNYAIGVTLSGAKNSPSKLSLIIGIAGNLVLLAYFKYMDFFITNINNLAGSHIRLLQITLPLGISFFTFTQIAYLVDAYRRLAKEYSFLNYFLFVTFFPHLLAGPIIHHKEMMPQFDRLKNKLLNHRNLVHGLLLFFVGLFKKVVIADTLAVWADQGFDHATVLNLVEAWTVSLSYSLQLYFDFSGYTDMALGSSLMLNIRLPINFNSPYRSFSIQEFWRRWHMTLGRFIRDYVYIPLGGNRVSEMRIIVNLIITFFIIGLWHGAGWTFVCWGLMHGCAIVAQRAWGKLNINLPKLLAWLLTFNFVNFSWIFFRAKKFDDAIKVVKGMFGINGLGGTEQLTHALRSLKRFQLALKHWLGNIDGDVQTLAFIAVCLILSIYFRNSNDMEERFSPSWKTACMLGVISLYAMLNLQKASQFIYFNF